MIAVDQGMAPVPGTDSTNTRSINEKKSKKRPIRRSGHWCEFLSSKGKLYYFHIKKGITQWTKPESWNDEQAYEPVKKAPRVETEPVITNEPEVTTKAEEEQKWSTSLTSLKAKVRQKMETKNYQKDRRNKFLVEIDAISNHSLKQEEVNLASMLPLTSYQSMGLELRELISEKGEKKANQLDKERTRGNVNLLEVNSKISLNKRQIQDSFKLLDYTNLRLKSFADNSSNNQS